MTAPPRPSLDNLQRFLLGTLPPAEAQPAVSWVESSPDAPRALAGVAAHDALTAAVASTVRVTALPESVVASVAQNATDSFRAAARLPDVSEQTRPTPADAPRSGSTGDWSGSHPGGPVRFGHFRVVRELGQGGMGVVYEAVDEKLGRRAAVKVLGEKWKADDDARRRFEREARAIADLTSDHVVTVFQVGDEGGIPFMAMELIEGVTLDQWLKTRPAPVTVEEILWAARDLLAGLAAVHKKGRMHRDIKPTNAMLVRDTRRLKILDFGLTRDADGGNQFTASETVLGTAPYMSPEQARGERLDARTDLFSTGVVLYRMVFGRSPFQRDTFFNTLHAVGHGPPPPPLTELSPALSAFVARLMAPDREDRPADAGAALVELQQVEAELAAPTEPAQTRPVPFSPPVRRHRRQFQIGCVVTVAFCLLLAPVIVVLRDKDGKEIARLKVADDAARGGRVEVTDTKGNKTVVPLTPNKGEPKTKQAPPAPTWPAPGARGVVLSNTSAFASSTAGQPQSALKAGTTFTLLEYPADGDSDRCLVRLDGSTDGVWVAKSFVLGNE